MKSKYMSRKFLVSMGGLVVSVVSTIVNNTPVAIAGIFLAGCFVIGESIVDAHSCVKQEMKVTKTTSKSVYEDSTDCINERKEDAERD